MRLELHHPKPFRRTCRACGVSFTNEEKYRVHMRDVAPYEYTTGITKRLAKREPQELQRARFQQGRSWAGSIAS